MTNLDSDKQAEESIAPSDDRFLITASAVTLALRPFHLNGMDVDGYDMNRAYAEYVVYILTIPYLFRCLPSLLLPAVRHPSILQPCLSILSVRFTLHSWCCCAMYCARVLVVCTSKTMVGSMGQHNQYKIGGFCIIHLLCYYFK